MSTAMKLGLETGLAGWPERPAVVVQLSAAH